MSSQAVAGDESTETIPGLTELWAETTGDPRVCIAVLDGPVDLSHPSLVGADLVQVETLASRSVKGGSSLVHGTHVASILFGQHDGPIKGITPRCRGLVVPIFEDLENGETKPCSQVDLARAILQASQWGAHIINISGGQHSSSGEAFPLLADTVRGCIEKGILVVAAAGNRGCDCLDVPGALPSVLTVGAMDSGGHPLDFSNWGVKYQAQGVLALGDRVIGASPGGGVIKMSGTSTAAPIVSGVAALLLSLQLKLGRVLDPQAVKEAILRSALGCDYQKTTDCRRLLVGRLNIRGAVERIKSRGNNMGEQNEDRPASAGRLESEQPQEQVLTSGVLDSPPIEQRRAQVTEDPGSPPITVGGAIMSKESDSVVPSGCGCGCGGATTTAPQLVYVIGKIGYDFGSRPRLDSLQFNADGDHAGNPLPITLPINFLKHLFGWRETYADQAGSPVTDVHRPHMYDAKAVIWTLSIDATPVYAIQPTGPFAEAAYEELAGFLLDQEGLRDPQGAPLLDVDVTNPTPYSGASKAEYVAIAGVIVGSVRLLTGEIVPVIVPDMRGTASWDTPALIDALTKKIKDFDADRAGEVIERLAESARNLGVAPEQRAINYVATNVFDVVTATRLIGAPDFDLDEITVRKSAVCRAESDCYDVEVSFYNPNNLMQARRVTVTTIDVSDVVPTPVGKRRTFTRR